VTADLVRVLEQGLRVIERLDAASYGPPRSGLAAYGPGAHFRHVLDACLRLLDGHAEGRVDYDRRERELCIEVDPRWAAQRYRETIAGLRELARLDPTAVLRVRMDAPAGIPAAEGWQESSLGRELGFLASHAIHHYALIALLLRTIGIEPGEEFGVAPSTLEHWRGSELVHR